MKIKTSELIDVALDWAVAKCEGHALPPFPGRSGIKECWINVSPAGHEVFAPSTDGSQGVPIIEREGIQWINNGRSDRAGKPYKWLATKDFSDPLRNFYGPTILVACLRCYVASRLGDEVDVPEELCHEG